MTGHRYPQRARNVLAGLLFEPPRLHATMAELTDGLEAPAIWTGDPRPGTDVPVDLNKLVEAVYVAPADPLLPPVVSALVDRFGLDADVHQSSLDLRPRF